MSAKAGIETSRGARVITRTPLLYRRGADASLDRPAHVRAGSALAALADGRLAVVQDDACFLAVIDPSSGAASDLPFPGFTKRQFDEKRGNKKEKLDLEAVFAGPSGVLVALGSGSSPVRERVVLIEEPGSDEARVTIIHAPDLYAQLRSDRSFSGSELNLEGAVVVGDDVLLFQRGNGAPSERHTPVDATARVALAPLLAYLRGEGAAPALRDVRGWDLGSPDGHRLTFTDGAVRAHADGHVIGFLACAEDSPDATRDGPVSAVMLGCLDEATGTCVLGAILNERGEPLLDKAEGLAFDLADPSRAFVVTDRDDPDAPSELLVLQLGDAWLPGRARSR